MKVLIIDDEPETVEFISIAFAVGWPRVDLIPVGKGQRGIELAESQAPDLVILDLGLPDIDGFEVLKQIRCFSQVPIIIVTVRNSEADIVKGLEWGADEYIVKPFGQFELLARIRALLRRQHHPELGEPIICGPLHFDPSSDQLICGPAKIHLTHTEVLIMHLLMKNVGHITTYNELAEAIWGDIYPKAENTIRVYIRRLRVKIESEPQCKGFIRSQPGVGYILDVPSWSEPLKLDTMG